MGNLQVGEDLIAEMELANVPVDDFAREAIVLDLYRRGTISSRRAAILLGMERIDFIKYSGERGIPYFRMTQEELQEELAGIGLA